MSLTGLSFIGKTTLFSRVALSPQQNEKKQAVNKNTTSNAYEGGGNMGGVSSMMAGNQNQSTTIGNNTTNKTMLRTSNSTFKDAVQKGVLSGIGLLKKQ